MFVYGLEEYIRGNSGTKVVDIRKWFEVPAEVIPQRQRDLAYSVGDTILFGKRFTYHFRKRCGKYYMKLG